MGALEPDQRARFSCRPEFAEAARKITKAAGPEINDEMTAITAGAVTSINQIHKLKNG